MSARKATPTLVPLSRPDLTDAEAEAAAEVVRGGVLSDGPRVEEFEAKCAKIAGRAHGVAVASGTAGLRCAVLAAGVGPGDEVIVTPFADAADAVVAAGAVPVFADVDPRTLNLDPKLAEARITGKTKAVVATETFGHPGGIDAVESVARRNELVLIEDAREGFGGRLRDRPVGSFGRAGVFGFGPSMQATAGEGGVVVTDDDRFAAVCRGLRDGNGSALDCRMSELHAAIGCVQIGRLDDLLDGRRRAAAWYTQRLMDSRHLILPTPGEDEHASWSAFVVRLNDRLDAADRDEVLRRLRMRGVGCEGHHPPAHLRPHLAGRFGFAEGMCPVAEHVGGRTVALPFFSGVTREQVERACDALGAVLEEVLIAWKRPT